jgi:hypothetical protein
MQKAPNRRWKLPSFDFELRGAIVMSNFTPISPAIGGALIGGAAVLLTTR